MTGSLRPFFSFYGGKWRIAPRYPPPEHDVIVEPFAGSAGYAVRYPDRIVVLCDVRHEVAGLWRWLTRVSPREVLALPAVVEDVRNLDVCQEAKWLIGYWLNKASATPHHMPSAWMRSGVRPMSHWGPEIRERIASQVERIRHWVVVQGSYERLPDVRATWFVDPPYQVGGMRYMGRRTPVDYDALAVWTRRRRGLTIACDRPDATWLPFEPFHVAKVNSGPRGRGHMAEGVWVRRTRVV